MMDATRHFHRVNLVIPEDQELFSVGPDEKVGEALNRMRERKYSHAPVMTATRTVLGIFSLRAVTNSLLRRRAPRDIAGARVEQFLEEPEFLHKDDHVEKLNRVFEDNDVALVGSREHLIAVLTPGDLARYLARVTLPFVLVEEIERTLRVLLRSAMCEEDVRRIARDVLEPKYRARSPDLRVPELLDEMSLGDQVDLAKSSEAWPLLEKALGERNAFAATMSPVPERRNDAFHFRLVAGASAYDLAVADLREARDWLRVRAEVHRASQAENRWSATHDP